MRIVKKGNLEKEFFYECKDCECVFALTGKELIEMKKEHTNPDGTVSPWDVVCPECGNMNARNIEAPAENLSKCEARKKLAGEDAGKRVVKKIHSCPYLGSSSVTLYENGQLLKDYVEDWCIKKNMKCPTGGKTDGGICKYL